MHHLKKLNQGLENKIIELQQKLMAQVSTTLNLARELDVLNDYIGSMHSLSHTHTHTRTHMRTRAHTHARTHTHTHTHTYTYIFLTHMQYDINKAMKADEAKVVELQKQADECAHYKDQTEKASTKIKELEAQLEESLERARMAEEKGEKEVALLKQTHEERENSLLEKIRKLEMELESLKMQHQRDTKGKHLN